MFSRIHLSTCIDLWTVILTKTFLSNSISYHESIVDTGRTLHNKNTQNLLDAFYAFAKKTFF